VEELLRQGSEAVALAISVIAVLIVAWGSMEAAIAIIRIGVSGRATHGARKEVWRRLGMWLLLGLEFELAADIVETVISPSWVDIGQLAAIAATRTFLNYFLEKDLDHSAESELPAAVAAQNEVLSSHRTARLAQGTSE
jgi:uncharacterized membrane protein